MTLDQKELIGAYRTYHLKAIQYTFFSSTHGTFSRIQQNSNLFNRIEITSNIFSIHSVIKLKINYKKTEKFINTWELTLF